MIDKQYESERRLADDLKAGDKCWINIEDINLKTLRVKHSDRRRKLNPKWYGPVEIVARTGVLSYRVKLSKDVVNNGLHDVFHVKNIRRYEPNKADFDWSSTLPEVERNEQQYEVEEILQHKYEKGINKFLVSWKGYDSLTSASFVTEAELRRNASEMLEEYMSKHRIATDNTWASGESSSDPG